MEKKAMSKSPAKRVSNYRNILKDRFNLGKVKKVEMVDAWTQTSNPETPTKKEEAKESEDNPTLKTTESMNANIDNTRLDDSPVSLYKRQDTGSSFRVRVNSTIKDQKSFRSPISSSMARDYKKRQNPNSRSTNEHNR